MLIPVHPLGSCTRAGNCCSARFSDGCISVCRIFSLLFFASIWGAIFGFVAFWAILFTGGIPQSIFEYRSKPGMPEPWCYQFEHVAPQPGRRLSLLRFERHERQGAARSRISGNIEQEPAPSQAFLRLVILLHTARVLSSFRMIATAFLTFLAWWVVLSHRVVSCRLATNSTWGPIAGWRA